MEKLTVVITDPVGLHARPASKIAGIASKFKSDIKLISGEQSANAKSIMNIMALAVKQGQEITLEISGDDEKEALDKIKEAMVENNLI
ncbi:HPr family phosphocarrier protein [Mycoplasma procyoni]|uniref:HPr family phosphocarrier protein n=1 Tax=Mycoplasma procyoni TaxID=568784 RepID=UPI00197C0D9A|nr:HPr family phosphocarrier protein [Mycoplasma procyoni]MBN3534408.1 HPr family phosphocarrier protein [Mycoplasma procyoni]